MQRLAPGLVTVVALAAVLTACGPKEPAKDAPAVAVTSSADGQNVTVTTQGGEVNVTEGATVVAGGRPAFAPDYPGGHVETTITANETDKVGGIYGFTTADSTDKVFTFYRGKAEAAGLQSQTNIEAGGARIYGAQGAAGDVAVTATPRGAGVTYVQVTWSTPKG